MATQVATLVGLDLISNIEAVYLLEVLAVTVS